MHIGVACLTWLLCIKSTGVSPQFRPGEKPLEHTNKVFHLIWFSSFPLSVINGRIIRRSHRQIWYGIREVFFQVIWLFYHPGVGLPDQVVFSWKTPKTAGKKIAFINFNLQIQSRREKWRKCTGLIQCCSSDKPLVIRSTQHPSNVRIWMRDQSRGKANAATIESNLSLLLRVDNRVQVRQRLGRPNGCRLPPEMRQE